MSNESKVVPYIRANEIEFFADHLKPYKPAHFFFDSVLADKFVQKSSSLQANIGFDATVFDPGEGVYCSGTGGYGTVIAASPTTLYLNDNYVSLNVTYFGSNIYFSANDFVKDDVVFASPNMSSNAAANVYSGRVEHFDPLNNVLVVEHLTGTPIAGGTSSCLFNMGKLSGNIANISSIGVYSGNKFPSGYSVASSNDVTKVFTVEKYSHNHGSFSSEVNSTTIKLDSYPPATAIANLIYFTTGTGIGSVRTITSNTGATITVNSAISISGNTKYSLGTVGTSSGPVVDEYGIIAGVFQLPETNDYKFKSGNRVFSIVDTTVENDPDNQMKSTAEFVSFGVLENIDKSTPVVHKNPVSVAPSRFSNPQLRSKDPVAQTFYTPDPSSNVTNYGIFVSSIDLFFKNKPDTGNTDPALPVTLKIVKTLNGYPTEDIVALTSVSCDQVNVADGVNTFPDSQDPTTLTKFKFDDPVYLLPSQQYAIVVISDSPSYELWISELGGTVINDPTNSNRRVSEQPYVGSFFRSQNASTWTPFQNEDLMFVINKAVFSTSNPPTLMFNAIPPTSNVGIHAMTLLSSDIAFSQANINYSFRSTSENTLITEAAATYIEKNRAFNFSSDLKNSSKNNSRKRIILAGNANSMFVNVAMSTNNPDISPMINMERLSLVTEEYLINDGKISNNNITIIDAGGYHDNVANIVVTISSPQLTDGITATANVLPSGLAANTMTGNSNIVAINLINPGSGYVESPTITISENNILGQNAKAVIVSEDGTSGGNALARYITKKIVLSDGFDAGDLRVYVDAIRPSGTHIVAYYKVLSATDHDSFDNKTWQRMYLDTDIYSPDTVSPVELVFRPAENSTTLSYVKNGITYPLGGTFKYFSIKLVMLASDASVPPIVQNMRAIALPGG